VKMVRRNPCTVKSVGIFFTNRCNILFFVLLCTMPFTGADFNAALDIKTDQAYTGYYDLAKKSIIVAEALNKAIEIKVATNDRIQVQDDFFGIYKTNAPFTPVLNDVSLIPGGTGIDDYHHIMNIRAQFLVPVADTTIVSLTNTTPVRMVTSRDTNLRSRQKVFIVGSLGNTNANGTKYVKRRKPDYFELFSDENLTVPVAGNGVYPGSGASLSYIYDNTAYDLKSSRKFSTLSSPTVHDPYYEMADTVMKIYPINTPCSQVAVDYISTPLPIDLTDTTDDLLEVYSQRILYFILDNSARILGGDMFDANLAMRSEAEMIQQP